VAQIEQVCLALMTNAIEAMPQGGTLSVATALGEERGQPHLELRVADSGHGIPADQIAKIFRLFYTRKARGTGVGLATVKRIVDGHHGWIDVDSREGRGTTFRVWLPLHPTARSADAKARAATG
jgi:signal transduction histidine kinase